MIREGVKRCLKSGDLPQISQIYKPSRVEVLVHESPSQYLESILTSRGVTTFLKGVTSMKQLFSFLLIFFLIPIFVSAQQSDSVKTTLSEVVVTATRGKKPLSEIGRSVSVITRTDLNNFIYLTPSEALSYQEGINIVGNGQTPGSLQNIYMRGANSNQTVIMIDGLRITDPSSVENAIDLSELSLANVQRIETVRGSHSTLYGSSAIGGVINFITEKNMRPGFNAEVNLRMGTFGEGTSDLSQNVLLNYTAHNGFYLNGGVYNTKINGLDATVKNKADTSSFKNYDKDNFKKLDLLVKTGYTINDFDMYASLKRTSQKADIDAGAFKDDNNYTTNFQRNLFSYGGSYKLNKALKFSVTGGYTDSRRIAVNDSSVIDVKDNTDHSYFKGTYDGTVFNNEVQANISLNNIDAVFGGGLYRETMNNKTLTIWGTYKSEQDLDTLNITAVTRNLFAYVNIGGGLLSSALSGLSLALGSRYSNHSTFGNNLTYEINPSYKITKYSLLYISFATGFNTPSLYRQFSPDEYFPSRIIRGNKDLKPEISQSFEIGWKQDLSSAVSLSASWFNTEVENNIEFVYLWDNNIPINDLGNDWSRNDYRGDTYLNLGTLITSGFEFNVKTRITDQLLATINYSYVHGNLNYSQSEIDQTHTLGNRVQLFSNGVFLNKDVEQENLVRRANTANFSLIYIPLEYLMIKLNVKYVGRKDDVFYDVTLGPYGALGTQQIPDYTLFDIVTKYNILQNLSASLRIENLLDKKYSEIRGYTSRGRGAYLNFRYNFHN